MNTLKIKSTNLHSVADIVTNSSSEVYTFADSTTLSNIKSLVNSLFAIAGSTLTFDDVFTAHLEVYDIEYKIELILDDAGIEDGDPEYEVRFQELLKDSQKENFSRTNPGSWEPYFDSYFSDEWDEVPKTVVVSIKNNLATDDMISAATLLNSLGDWFNHEEVYN